LHLRVYNIALPFARQTLALLLLIFFDHAAECRPTSLATRSTPSRLALRTIAEIAEACMDTSIGIGAVGADFEQIFFVCWARDLNLVLVAGL
jgi:hypothetical protein